MADNGDLVANVNKKKVIFYNKNLKKVNSLNTSSSESIKSLTIIDSFAIISFNNKTFKISKFENPDSSSFDHKSKSQISFIAAGEDCIAVLSDKLIRLWKRPQVIRIFLDWSRRDY